MAVTESPTSNLLARTAFNQDGAIITVAGELDRTSTLIFDDEIAQIARVAVNGPIQVTLDISGLQYVDAIGISSILQGMEMFRAAGAELEMRYPSPMAPQLFEICSSLQFDGVAFVSDMLDAPAEEDMNVGNGLGEPAASYDLGIR